MTQAAQSPKKLMLSLIIPVYNEERQIKACLDAVAAQNYLPDEVLVIDNNCRDKTIEIALQYPFVTVVKEPRQGLIAARNKGFNTARGDILARIDADARLAPDWAERVRADFTADSALGGVCGLAYTATIPLLRSPRSTMWSYIYYVASDAFFRVRILWGANMALRRSAWKTIKSDTYLDDRAVHEDQDLSLVLAAHAIPVQRDKQLLMSTEGQSYHYWPKFSEYTLRRWRTKSYHAKKGLYRSPDSLLLPRWRSTLMMAIMFVPMLVFVASSLALFPFQYLAARFTSPAR